jgi:hypothetical protein
MSTAMTFNSLLTDLQNYLERGTLNDVLVNQQLPELINFGERRCSRELKVLGYIVPAVFQLQAGLAVYAKPDRWRQTVSMNVSNQPTGTAVRQQMFPRAYEYIRSYWPDDTATPTTVYGTPAPPKFYADYNYQNWIFAPTPDAAYPAEVLYYEEPPLLSAANQSNWLTQYAPRLLLYACIIETLIFLKKGSRIAEIQPQYDREAAMLNNEDTDKILDRTSTRQKD